MAVVSTIPNLKKRIVRNNGIAFIIIVFLSVCSSFVYLSFDVTDASLYSISSYTKQVLHRLPEGIVASYYVSSNLENISSVPAEIRDILMEYQRFSYGRLMIQIAPLDNATDLSMIERLGIQPQQIDLSDSVRSDSQMVFSGLVISYQERQEVIPLVFNSLVFEYEFTTALQRLITGKKPEIAVVFGNNDFSLSTTHQYAHQELRQQFSVTEYTRGQSIPSTIDAVFLIGAKDLRRSDIVLIDNYLVQGGSVLVAASAVHVDIQQNLAEFVLPESHPFLEWLDYHGVRLRRALVLDRECNPILVQNVSEGIEYQEMVPYPHWIHISGNAGNPMQLLTERFAGLDVYWTSPIRLVPAQDRTISPLLHTGASSWILENDLAIDPHRAGESRQQTGDFDGNYIVAGLVEGVFHSWSSFHSEPGTSRLLVVGDEDWTSDLMNYSNAWYNLAFLHSIADWFVFDSDLLAIRNKTLRDTRLHRIENQDIFRMRALAVQFFHIVLLPLGILVFGFLYSRKARK